MAHFVVLEEVRHPHHPIGGPQLCLQLTRLEFGTVDPPELGYRFMWRDSAGRMSSRPCRIDSLHDALTLMRLAIEAGWGNFDGQVMGSPRPPLAVTIGDLVTTIDGSDGAGDRRPVPRRAA